jgi:glycolate oxidase
LRRLAERRASWVIRVPALSDGLSIYNRLMGLEDLPYSLEIVSPGRPGPYGEMGNAPLLLATQEGGAADVEARAARIKEALSGTGLELDATAEARDLWKKRFSNLLERREEGSFQSAGLLLGDDALEGFISYLRGGGPGGENLGFVCSAVERGKSLVTVGCFSGGAGEPSPLGAFARVRKAIAAGVGMGGVPYGVGIWNSPYIDVILGDRRRELRRIKREVDRLGIMNPGKFFSMTTRSGLPVPGWVLGVYLGLAGR